MADLKSISDLFWSKVDRSGGPDACWPFLGAKSKHGGYGRVGALGKDYRAHRLAWILAKGPIPKGKKVLHHCDNPPCCNYEKCLFVGTQAENIADMVAKGRVARGEIASRKRRGDLHHNAKLTADQVVQIRAEYQRGSTGERGTRGLAIRFGVSRSAIQHITSGRKWRYVA